MEEIGYRLEQIPSYDYMDVIGRVESGTETENESGSLSRTETESDAGNQSRMYTRYKRNLRPVLTQYRQAQSFWGWS